MPTTSVRRALLSRTVVRWRSLLARRKGMIALLLVMAGLACLWLPSFWESEWTSTAVLRTPADTWPLAFAPDGRTFASWGGDGITLWDVATGRKQVTWKVADGQVVPVGAFSPDGRTFASLRFAYPGPITIDLIDVETGRTRASLPTQHSTIFALMFSDEGRSLRAFLGDMNSLKQAVAWDVATGKEISSRPLTCRTSGAATAVSPDGHLMALAPFDGKTIRIWDLDADRVHSRLAHPSSSLRLAPGLAFSRDGRTLVAGREDGSFELWDLATSRLKTTVRGHTGGYESFGIQLAPDGRSLASRGEFRRPDSVLGGVSLGVKRSVLGNTWKPDSEVIVVDLATGRRLARAASSMHPHYSPDGSTIATRQTNLTIRLRPAPGRRR
jgi:WD40 repeat protein